MRRSHVSRAIIFLFTWEREKELPTYLSFDGTLFSPLTVFALYYKKKKIFLASVFLLFFLRIISTLLCENKAIYSCLISDFRFL